MSIIANTKKRARYLVAPALCMALAACAGFEQTEAAGDVEAADDVEAAEPVETAMTAAEDQRLAAYHEGQISDEMLATAIDLSEAEPDEAAAETAACGKPLRSSTDFNHGGNAFERLDIYTFGGTCDSCFERSHAVVTHSGHGSCQFLGWKSTSPTDCRISVGVVTSGGFANGTCHVKVYEQLAD